MAATSCLFLITGECLTDDDIGPLSELIVLGVHAWDSGSLGFDLNEELKTFVSSNPSSQSFNADEKGESVIRVFSDSLCVAALINPGLFTLASQLEWLLKTPFANRHLVFAGRQSEELGDWLLKDAAVSPARLAGMLRSVADASLPPDHKFSLSCPVNGAGASWKSAKPPVTEFRAHAAQSSLDQSTVPGAVQLAGFLAGKQCGLAGVEQRLRPAGTVGNIRIAKPTLYVFPAGLGDSCYLGVDGFGLLVNTGAGRTPAFWPFLAHLDRVDGLLLSHWDHDNLPGLLALLERLSVRQEAGGPSLGCALLPCRPRGGNGGAAEDLPSPQTADANGGQHQLEASVRREAAAAMRLFRSLGVPLEDVRRQGQPQPMTLYSKLGNGTLDLYPLQPIADAKEFKDFVAQLQGHAAGAAGKPWPLVRVGNSHVSPAHANSLCCLLVWKPSDPKLPWTRLLLPGCCPQLRVIEGLDRVKSLDCLKTAEYSPAHQKAAAVAAAAPVKKPAATASAKPAAAAAAASGDHPTATKKPATTVTDSAAPAKPKSAPAAAAAKKPQAAPAAPIVKKPVSSASDPAKAAAAAAPAKTPATASASVKVTASAKMTTSVTASVTTKKDAAPTSKAAAKAPASAPASKKPASAKAKKEGPAAAASKAAAPAAAAAAAATPTPPPTADSLVTEEQHPAGVEEISLPAGADAEASTHAADTEPHEAWALNTNNTNSAEADSAELVALDGDASAGLVVENSEDETAQPLALPAPPPPSAGARKGAGSAATTNSSAAAVNYGPVHPFYFDLAYLPGHGERQYADAEYFKRVRARYYVLSSCDPQSAALDALLEGKAAWPDAETTLIPTHSNDLVTAWLAANSERLQQLHVAIAPSASNCRIKLQNEEDQICTAYRVEF